MSYIPVPITGAAYKSPSQPTNYQLCINQYPTAAGPGGRGSVSQSGTGTQGSTSPLIPTMGTTPFINLGSAPIRAMKNINNTLYAVCGSSFYSITLNPITGTGTSTTLGTLLTTTGYVSIANNNTQIMISDGQFGYIYYFNCQATVALGPIGGSAGDTYTLTIAGVGMYNGFGVSTALTGSALVSEINLYTSTTNVVAGYNSSSGLTLQGINGITSFTIVESGTGFVPGTDGITIDPNVAGGSTIYGPFRYDGFKQFTQILDPNFTVPGQITYVDGYFIYNQPNTAKFWFSQLNDGTAYSSLNFATIESRPDLTMGTAPTKGELWVFGQNHVEVWYDEGNAPPGSPFSKQVGSDIDIGVVAPWSIVQVNDLLMWMDSRGFIAQSDVSPFLRGAASGFDLKKISDESVDNEIDSYAIISDAVACSYNDHGHIMYEISFPSEMKTWVYDATTQSWHQKAWLNPITGQLEHSLCQFCDRFQNLLVCGGVRNGQLYILSRNTYTDAGQPIIRKRTTSIFESNMKQIGVDSIEVRINCGQALPTGQGSNPQMMLRYSNDGGYTWSYELWRSIGDTGQYANRVIWNRLGTHKEWLLEFTFTDPIDYSIIEAVANISVEKL
jgi:hypothetical protein